MSVKTFEAFYTGNMKLLPKEMEQEFLCDLFGWTEKQLHETSIPHIQKRLLLVEMKEKAKGVLAKRS